MAFNQGVKYGLSEEVVSEACSEEEKPAILGSSLQAERILQVQRPWDGNELGVCERQRKPE